jgi:hypothetical protein
MEPEQFEVYTRTKSSLWSVKGYMCDKHNQAFRFILSGETDTYALYIPYTGDKKGTIHCNCKDFSIKSKYIAKRPYLCKHCLAILVDYTKLFPPTHPFYTRCVFTTYELKNMYTWFKQHPHPNDPSSSVTKKSRINHT